MTEDLSVIILDIAALKVRWRNLEATAKIAGIEEIIRKLTDLKHRVQRKAIQ